MMAAFMVINGNEQATIKRQLISYGGFGILNVSLFYINYIFLIPELIKKRKKYAIYVFVFFLLIVASALVKTTIAVLNPEDMMRYQMEGKKSE